MRSARSGELSLRILKPVIAYVAAYDGEAAVLDLAAQAGLDVAELHDARTWVSHAQFEALLAGARARMASDDELMRACTFELRKGYGPVLLVLRATSVRLVYEAIARTMRLVSRVSAFDIVEARRASITMRYTSRCPESRLMCLSRQAQLRSVPTLWWGHPPPTLREEGCIARGDPACTYRLRWVEPLGWWWPVLTIGAAGAAAGGAFAATRSPAVAIVCAALGLAFGALVALRRTIAEGRRFQEETSRAVEQLVASGGHAEAEVRGEALARGVVMHAIQRAIRDAWGEEALRAIAAALPSEIARATTGPELVTTAWHPVAHVAAWQAAVLAGPARGDPDAYAAFVARALDVVLGRLQRAVIHVMTPAMLAQRAEGLWRSLFSRGEVTVLDMSEAGARVTLSDHPFVDDAVGRLTFAEMVRHVVALSRAHDVRQRHALDAEGRVVVDLAWNPSVDVAVARTERAPISASTPREVHAARPLRPGERFGRYVVEDVLGEGGMGIVYRAHDTHLDRTVALKVLHPDAEPDAAAREAAAARLLREGRAAASIRHPNAVAIFDVGESDGTPFLAMELVEGRTLRAYVGERSAPLARRIRWLADVASALAAAHKRGVVHRDVKPENVIVGDDGVVKVLDFGIARRARVASPAPFASPIAARALESSLAGTPQYMAPEQLRGEPVDERTDQFAWGVLAYELLAGQHPWHTAKDAVAMATSILSLAPRPPSASEPRLSADVEAIVLRALHKRPEARFASMDELSAALRRIEPAARDDADAPGARDDAAVAPSRSPVTRTLAAIAPPRSRRARAIGVASVIVAIVAALVAWAIVASR